MLTTGGASQGLGGVGERKWVVGGFLANRPGSRQQDGWRGGRGAPPRRGKEGGRGRRRIMGVRGAYHHPQGEPPVLLRA